MYAGGSGEFSITHVKLMVDPLSIYKSGPPIICVVGSANKINENVTNIHIHNIIKNIITAMHHDRIHQTINY